MTERVERKLLVPPEHEHSLGYFEVVKPCEERLAELVDSYNVLADRIEAAWRERDAAEAEAAALRANVAIALNGLPDAMHPEIPRWAETGIVSAQVLLLHVSGDDDPGNVELARAALEQGAGGG